MFTASPTVWPTDLSSPSVSRKPFRNVAMRLAILRELLLIPCQLIVSSACFNFSPTMPPIAVRSALFHASRIEAARFFPSGTSSNASAPVSSPPPAPPDDPVSCCSTSRSSNLASAFSAFFADAAVPSRDFA